MLRQENAYLDNKRYSRTHLPGVPSEGKNIGYKLDFNGMDNGWIQSSMLVDMTRTWHREGVKATGTNYFTMGDVKNGFSTRYDPSSEYYQAWLGGYIADFGIDREWTIQDHFKLAVADQKKWLWYYGDPNPILILDKSNKPVLDSTIKINGFDTKLYYWSALSHSDIGNKSRTWYVWIVMQIMAHIMNRRNKGLTLKGTNFIPPWKKYTNLKPYEEMTYTGFVAVVKIKPTIKAVLYAAGSRGNEQKQYLRKLITQKIQVLKL